MVELKGIPSVIIGLHQTGKSKLANYFCRTYPDHWAYDTVGDYAGLNRYIPKFARNNVKQAQQELNYFLSKIVPQKPDLIVIDEAGRYCLPFPNALPHNVQQLIDYDCSHSGIGIIFIDRKMTNLPPRITEVSQFFIFRMVGHNEVMRLNSMVEGLGDAVLELKPYHFIHMDRQRNWQVMNPIPL